MPLKIAYVGNTGTTRTFELGVETPRVAGVQSFDDMIKTYQNQKLSKVYYPATLITEQDVVRIFTSVTSKMYKTNASEEDLQHLAATVFMKGDGFVYPKDLLDEVIETKNYANIKDKFDLVKTEIPKGTEGQQTSNDEINWSTLVVDCKETGDNITPQSAAYTILTWLYTQLRISSKPPSYVNNITENNPLITTPVKLNPKINARFLLTLYRTFSTKPDIMKYFQRGSLITRTYAYVLMMRNVPVLPTIPIVNFWAVAVKYHEMSAYGLYVNALTKWNKTDLDMIRIFYTKEAMMFYELVQKRAVDIVEPPYIYTYMSWFVESYVAEFSLRRFPAFSYVCWCLSLKTPTKLDSQDIPGLDLYPAQEDYWWDIAQDIMDYWSTPTEESADVVIQLDNKTLELIPLPSLNSRKRNIPRIEEDDVDMEEPSTSTQAATRLRKRNRVESRENVSSKAQEFDFNEIVGRH